MWRQMLKILPKNLNQFYRKQTIQKISQCHNKRIFFHTTFLLSATNVFLGQLQEDSVKEIGNMDMNAPVTDIEELQLPPDLNQTYAESGEALGNLIKTLHACIQEICEQYQHCIAKQIEITINCMQMEPVGAHWDEMTKYRVIADDLRVEFVKYCTLVSTIGSIVQNEPCNGDDKLLKENKIVKEAYQGLLQMIEIKSKENCLWDSKLVDVHMKSILGTDTAE